jgi:hypothetical protein
VSEQLPEIIAQAIPVTREALAPSRRQAGGLIRVSPGRVTLMAAPITVAATMLLGCGLLSFANLPIHPVEMAVGAMVNVVGGLLAGIALLGMMKRGAAGVAQAGILGIGFRCGTVLMGVLTVSCSGLALDPIILVYWVMAYYMPMLIVESMLVAWLTNHLPAGT